MKTERLEGLPRNEVREFYYTYLELPYPVDEPERVPHPLDTDVQEVTELATEDGEHPNLAETATEPAAETNGLAERS